MTIHEIKEMVKGPEYDFLRGNPHLKDHIIFLTLGGSYAYGTNIEGSDVDVRGCALNSRSDLLGLANFEQVVHTQTDTTIYAFNKLIKLLLNCNPNVIELLGCKSDHYFFINNIGQMLIDNRHLFVSQRAVRSFGGFASQQLRRLQNALDRGQVSQKAHEEQILRSMKGALKAFDNRYNVFDKGSVTLYTADSDRDDLDVELVADIHLEKFPARQFSSLANELSNVIGNYMALNHRNKKKDEMHLNKHAMHLVRLYHMCFDLLETGEINTFREKDHDQLMSIRNGCYMNEDGTYMPEFFELLAEMDERLEYDKQNTSLPKDPDFKHIEELVMEVNRKAIDI